MTALRSMDRLLELARLARSDDLDAVLAAVAACVADVLGYGTVVINLRRPAWDDFEAVHVIGSDDARRTLLGSVNPWEEWERLLRPEFERRGAYVHHHGETTAELGESYVPAREPNGVPGGWHPEDYTFVPLTDAAGDLLGIVSVDEPVSGLRPTDEELDALVAVASHASVALANAKASVEASRLRGALSDLLRVSQRVEGQGADAALDDICATVQEGLRFEKVVALVAGPDGDTLVPRAARGFPDAVVEEMRTLRLGALRPVLDERFDHHGCRMIDTHVAQELTGGDQVVYESANNGRGPRAWNGTWLLAPLHDAAGAVIGMLWVDDPEDRLLPDADRLRALRLFGDQAAAAIASEERIAHLRRLAHHDPLTGVRNRHGLTDQLDALLAEGAREGAAGGDAGGPVSLVFADLDHFKLVNDELGHDAGDAVLRDFGQVLMRLAAEADGTPVRLGGEEFCVVLPHHDRDRALAFAERVRLEGAAALSPRVPGLTLSAGIATSSPVTADAAALMRSADQALYAAKRLGRNRCVAYDPALPALDRRTPADEQADQTLPAVLLLARTLDLRDGGTSSHSRTVAHLAERTGAALGLEGPRLERLRIAGALHDIGKVAVPDAILGKPAPLDDAEWQEIRRHPETGAQILQHAGLDDVADWVLHHHERVDGRGYPHGLAAGELALEARVLSACDAYEAMTADRPYRTSMAHADAAAELRRCAGTQFDPDVVEALIRVAEDHRRASSSATAA